MQTDTRDKLRNRLKRIAGQVAAVRSALDSLGVELLSDHVEHCVAGHAEGNGHGKAKVRSKDELIHEVRQTLDRFLR